MSDVQMAVIIRDTLKEILAADSKCILLGEDIGVMGGAFGVTRGLHDLYPQQVIQTPISENSIVGLATGMAMMGLRPIVEIMFMDFITLAMDQILNHLTKITYMYAGQFSAPVIIRTPYGAKGGYGPSHSQALESLFSGIPGLQVVTPSDGETARGLLLSAVRSNNPTLILEPKKLYAQQFSRPEDCTVIPLDKARLLRNGNDLLIISYGNSVWKCLEVAEEFSKESGPDCAVLDLVSLKPLDWKTVKPLVEKTGKVVVVEEGHLVGGIGAEIAALIAEHSWDSLDGPVVRVGLPDCPIPSSLHLEQFVIPGSAEIKKAALRAWRRF